jgi:hypothetical protein
VYTVARDNGLNELNDEITDYRDAFVLARAESFTLAAAQFDQERLKLTPGYKTFAPRFQEFAKGATDGPEVARLKTAAGAADKRNAWTMEAYLMEQILAGDLPVGGTRLTPAERAVVPAFAAAKRREGDAAHGIGQLGDAVARTRGVLDDTARLTEFTGVVTPNPYPYVKLYNLVDLPD